MDALVIALDDPWADDVRALLETHLAFTAACTPPEDIFALDLDGLTGPGIAFYSARRAGRLLGFGALLEWEPGHGELKSMHTTAEARGQGVGRAMVEHLVGEARARGYDAGEPGDRHPGRVRRLPGPCTRRAASSRAGPSATTPTPAPAPS